MPERGTFFYLALLLAVLPLSAEPALAQRTERDPRRETGEETPPAETERTGETLAYQVSIEGPLSESLTDLLRESSLLIREQERPPRTFAALRRRVRDDLETFNRVLRSEAFYDAEITPEVAEERRPIEILIRVQPGPRYSFAGYTIDYLGTVEGAVPRGAEDVGLAPGEPALAAPIAEAESTLVRKLKESGYPFAQLKEKRYVIDRAAKTLTASLTVDPGARARFGTLRFGGLETVKESYLRRIAEWPEDELYDISRVEELRQSMGGTGLFSSVVVETAKAPGPDGRVPVTVEVKESPHRTIGFGLGYSTDEGPEADVLWEHRNLFGAGENLRLTLTASALAQSGLAAFRKPHFRRRDQSLALTSEIAHEDSDAFQELSFSQFVGLERQLSPHWSASAGPVFELSRIEDGVSRQTFGLIGFLVGGAYDSRDNPLNATEGFRLDLATTPFLSVYDEQAGFWLNEAQGSAYLAFDESARYVLAGRARIGSIVGSARSDIPANKRFYSGGGGSVRGYEFRKIGPLDDQNDPIGGRSVVEVGVEMRLRLGEDLGLVPFIEGGQVYPDAVPDFSESLLWAAGLGLRYYTAVGPVRFDIAVPLDKREGVDDDYQFYISLGQAF